MSVSDLARNNCELMFCTHTPQVVVLLPHKQLLSVPVFCWRTRKLNNIRSCIVCHAFPTYSLAHMRLKVH